MYVLAFKSGTRDQNMPDEEDVKAENHSPEQHSAVSQDCTNRIVDWSGSEVDIRRNIPVFVNSFNQLHYLRDTIDWFAENGFGNVTVLDNASSSTSLLQYLNSDACLGKAHVVHWGQNLGPRESIARVAEDPVTDSGFIFTDPDLRLPDPVAPNMLKDMFAAGVKHQCPKVGLSLSLDPEIIDLDLMWYRGKTVGQWERKFWRKEIEPGIFRAPVDTTFFLYVPQPTGARRFNDLGMAQSHIPALRFGREGYTAVHRPWLMNDDLPEDEIGQYLGSATNHSTLVRSRQQTDFTKQSSRSTDGDE